MTESPGARLVLFTKPAVAGRVKTRLSPELTPEQARQVHRALVVDATKELHQGTFELQVAWALNEDEEPDLGLLSGILEAELVEIRHVKQEGRELGARLYGALDRALVRSDGESVPAVAAVGSDHPEIDYRQVEMAFEAIEGGTADVVLGPAVDGGYYLIAVRGSMLHRRLFEEIEWSSSSVASSTLDRCAELGLEVLQLESACDLDTMQDLEQLISRVRRGDARLHGELERLLRSWGML